MNKPHDAPDGWSDLRLLAEGSDWKRDAGETVTQWAARTITSRTASSIAASSSIDYQQRRGMLLDTFDWAILEYDEYMRDDAYDAQAVLDKIIARLRDVRSMLDDRTPLAAERSKLQSAIQRTDASPQGQRREGLEPDERADTTSHALRDAPAIGGAAGVTEAPALGDGSGRNFPSYLS